MSTGLRPAISVVIPFRGGSPAATRLLTALSRLDVSAADELILADNTEAGVLATIDTGAARVVSAVAERSSYYARNAGARRARGEWLLFMDSDCVPQQALLYAYFAEPVADGCGALAGQILGDPIQRSLAARYARSRHIFDHEAGVLRAEDGCAAAGNLLVRREAFERLGGFSEGIRSGGDVDLCRRLGAAGWDLEFRPLALVHHRHRERLPSLLGAMVRYGAGSSWLNERYPGTSPRWPLRAGLTAAARDLAALAARGSYEAALFRAIDSAGLVAHNLGYLSGRRANVLRAQG
ncbi:MAG TPA: glycosyltransferase [Solirubrobacterales bacterium]|nr:glycosyltransferase [Solirubrobacterales bacterium]